MHDSRVCLALIVSIHPGRIGLDAASAANIMHEIVRVAKDERLIIVCTIHQPSTKVYNCFDQVMIMSKGREAFAGDVQDATPYFDSIGCPCPSSTNPAEVGYSHWLGGVSFSRYYLST